MELAGLGLKIGDRVLLRELCDKAVKSKFGVRRVTGPYFLYSSATLALWPHINVPSGIIFLRHLNYNKYSTR